MEIKPCPFCGGEADVHNVCACDTDDDEYYWIECNFCEVGTGASNSRNSAIAAWNKRVGDE